MKRITVATLLLFALFTSAARNASAQNNTRTIWLTALLDYAHSTVDFDGVVVTPDIRSPDLSAWGFHHTRQTWRGSGSDSWSIHGTINSARLAPADANGFYHLQMGPLVLTPDDDLTFIVPFVEIDYRRVSPPPDNLRQLITPTGLQQASVPPSVVGIEYRGGSGRTLSLDIPFTLIQKQISLRVTPLLGEMLLGRSIGFRFSGQVIIEQLHDFDEFDRHCQVDPVSLFYPYRAADLLFSLDEPPVFSFGLLNNRIYRYKPTYLGLERVDVVACRFESKSGGRVEATFDGGAVAQKLDPVHFPSEWDDAGTAKSNKEIITLTGGREYELKVGYLALAPNDVLTVTVQGAEVHDVCPPPTRFLFSHGHTPELVYAGPQKFALKIVYAPNAELLVGQLHTTARAWVKPIEDALRPFLDAQGAPLTWGLLILSVTLLAASWSVTTAVARGTTAAGVTSNAVEEIAKRSSNNNPVASLHSSNTLWMRLALTSRALGWALAAVALLYGLRGIFGLLALAVLAYISSIDAAKRWQRAVIASVLIFVAIELDRQGAFIFPRLTKLELEATPVTPLVFLVLGIVLTAVVAFPRAQLEVLLSRASLPLALALTAFAVFDVLQKSLLGLALLGMGAAYFLYRRPRVDNQMSATRILDRFRSAWKSRLIPIGVVLLILFAAQNGLQSTAAVLGSTLGIWGTLLMPILLLVSIVQGFLAVGFLFILVYPMLPFKAGYLKALALGVFLLLIFILGTGADDSLVSAFESLIVGRLVYYLSVPLLIGLYFDIINFMHAERDKQKAAGKRAEELTIEKAAPMYLKQLQGVLGTVGAIASLVVPSAYAHLVGNPLVTTYFDILSKLVSLSLGA